MTNRIESSPDTIVDALRRDILGGRFSPGERLLEIPLAEQYECGRAAIRSALVELTAEGLVVREANRGAAVRQISIDEAIQITEARAALEAMVAGLAARRADDDDRQWLVDMVAEMRKTVVDDRPGEYAALNRALHRRLCEIADHTVEIRGIAREPGFRTKVAVYSADPKVDPVGACVGLRGARVKNIVRELNNEKVDIIRWSDDVNEFVTDALKPAIIRSIQIVEDEKRIRVTVNEEDLSKAIGRRGQNARLTSRLVGWDVQIEKDESQHEAFEQRVIDTAAEFVAHLGAEAIDQETAIKLVKGGINDVRFFSMVDPEDIAEILGGDEEAARRIFDAAAKSGDPDEQASPESGDSGEAGGEAVAAAEGEADAEKSLDEEVEVQSGEPQSA